MKKRKFIPAVLFILGTITLTACLDDPEPPVLDVVSDVYVQKIVQDSVEKYSLSFWVIANKEIKSASAKDPEDETWNLSKDENNTYVYSLIPEPGQYTDSMPRTGNYTFTVVSTQEGEGPVTSTDKLEDDELGAVYIDSTSFTNNRLKVNWTVVQNADTYVLRLSDESDKLLYISPSIAGNKSNHTFGIMDAGWFNGGIKAEAGKTYKIELLAILFESTSLPVDQEYNIQFISTGSTDIVWGE